MSAQPPLVLNSLVRPTEDDAAKRAAHANRKTAISAPTTTAHGFPTRESEDIILVVEFQDATTTLDLTAYVYDAFAGKWSILTEFGTDGTKALDSADGAVQRYRLPIYGASRVAVATANLSGTYTLGINVWLASVSSQ